MPLPVFIGEGSQSLSRASACERARCVGYLAGVLLRAVEAAELTARLEALEGELKGRSAT